MKKQILVLEEKPNSLGTFYRLMSFAHKLHKKDGKNYSVKLDFKRNSVKLFVKEK